MEPFFLSINMWLVKHVTKNKHFQAEQLLNYHDRYPFFTTILSGGGLEHADRFSCRRVRSP